MLPSGQSFWGWICVFWASSCPLTVSCGHRPRRGRRRCRRHVRRVSWSDRGRCCLRRWPSRRTAAWGSGTGQRGWPLGLSWCAACTCHSNLVVPWTQYTNWLNNGWGNKYINSGLKVYLWANNIFWYVKEIHFSNRLHQHSERKRLHINKEIVHLK